MADKYCPTDEGVVWMDIEGSELTALKGAPRLLASRRVLLWNLEMLSHVPGMMTEVPEIMDAHGYKAVAEWNDSEACRDRIYLRDDVAAANPLCIDPASYRRDPHDPLLRML